MQSITMKKAALTLLTAAFIAAPVAAGNHFGEFKDLNVDVEYFDYAYKTPSGEPVYFIGSTIRYRVTIKNEGNRTYNNFQARSTLRWVGSVTCTRTWLDNQTVSYQDGTPLPGDSSSGWRPAEMKKGSSASIDASYGLPLTLCPGQGDIYIDGQHINSSGKSEAASFAIPLKLQLKPKG
ncbi:MAG: hypothetical protein HYZ74_07175 [Elusimicrobia bacterium]|nr:hypothetical protein [Elusimicrobiota bacterium]